MFDGKGLDDKTEWYESFEEIDSDCLKCLY